MSTVTEPQLTCTWEKTLTWKQGFAFALPMACGAFVSTGYQIGAIGAWGMLLCSGIMALVGLLSNFLFAEMATMFLNKAGSLSMYAREGLRKYFIPGGVLGAYGYWLGYSLSLAFNALIVGYLIQGQWFATSTWAVHIPGGVDLSIAHVVAIVVLVICWVLTLMGIKIAAGASLLSGAAFLVVIAVIIIGVFIPGKASAGNLTFAWPGLTAFIVWLYIAGWTLFSSEMGAAFAPEYKNAKRDVPRVLMLSAIFMMFTYLAPLSATAELGAGTVVQNPLTFAVLAANHVLGRGGPIFTIILVAALFVTTVMFTSDASRATASMAEEGDTLRQFAKQNGRGVPTWGTGVVIVINIVILLFAANPITILLASNLGYILAHSLANWSFVILRKSQPNADRPLKLKSPLWVPIAVILGCFHLVLLYVGITHPGLAGYGGLKETLFAIGILLTGLIFWVIRVVVQDHQPLRLRDKDYTVQSGEGSAAPDAAPAG